MARLSSSTPPIGGRYQVMQWVGAGGMQNVYAANDLIFKRKVALKTPKEGAALKRFQQSSVMSAKVNHENVAKTLDYIEDNGSHFLIEEFVEGCDLAGLVPDVIPALPPSTCARLFHQLARGLAASHHAGVVHRDLKPSNIMVDGGHRFYNVKITDFGIARMAEAEIGEWAGPGKAGTTSSKTVLGAIPYMSPESITNFSTSSYPADVWSVGAIIYHMMSGEFPFQSGLVSIPAILSGKIPGLPSIMSGLQFCGLGKQIYDIVLLCFEPDPSKRISAEGLINAIEPLCYAVDQFEYGQITRVNNNYWGFLRSDDGSEAFYHVDSFYNGAAPRVGQRVWFARHPGGGSDRAFPLVRTMR